MRLGPHDSFGAMSSWPLWRPTLKQSDLEDLMLDLLRRKFALSSTRPASEVRLEKHAGLAGDDAVEFLQSVQKESGLVLKTDLSAHFASEGLFSRRRGADLTVSQLASIFVETQ